MKFSQHNTKASKLTGEKVLEIRQKYASGDYTQERLSREYQVSITTIRNVVNYVTWQHLPHIQSRADEQTEAKLSEIRVQAMLDAGMLRPQGEEKKPTELPEELKPKKPNPYF